MSRAVRRLVSLTCGAILSALFLSAGVATADPVSAQPGGRYSSVLTLDGKVIVRSTSITPSGQGPTGQSLHCNIANNFPDGNGIYSVQHACRGKTGPWGYRINAAVCSSAGTPVHEAGMAWARNGRTQGTQSPHLEDCRYFWHGSYNPDLDYDHIAYSDVFTWLTKNGGHAQLQIYGNFTTSGTPCSPTSC